MGKQTSCFFFRHVDWFKGNCRMTWGKKKKKFGGSCRFPLLSISFDLGRYFIQGSINISLCRNGVKIHMGSASHFEMIHPTISNHWRDSDKKSRKKSRCLHTLSWVFQLLQVMEYPWNHHESPMEATKMRGPAWPCGGRIHRAFLKCGEPSYPRSKLLVI